MLMLPGNILGDQKDSPCVCYIEPGSKTKLLPMVKSVVCSGGLQAEQLGETAVSGGMCNQIWLVMCSACICFVRFAAVPGKGGVYKAYRSLNSKPCKMKIAVSADVAKWQWTLPLKVVQVA